MMHVYKKLSEQLKIWHRSNREGTETTAPPRGMVPWIIVLSAVISWIGSLALLLLFDLRAGTVGVLDIRRLFLVALVIIACVLTFGPVQLHMEIPGVTIQGAAGIALFFYIIAFVPPPTGSIASLPDMPVYVLLMLAVFWSIATISVPFVYALRQRLLKQRAARLDVRHAWRQAYEIGFLSVWIIVLAGLHVLTWISFSLVVLIVITFDLIFWPRRRQMTHEQPDMVD